MNYADYHESVYRPGAAARVRASTLAGYDEVWERHLKPAWGHWDMADIDAGSVERWLASVPTAPLRHKLYAALKRELNRAVHDGHLERNPCDLVDAPRRPEPMPDALDERELRRLLRGYWGAPLEAWLLVSVTCGLRREEACALRWSDVDLRGGRIEVRHTYQRVGGVDVMDEPKTAHSRRPVYLPRFALERLRQIKGRGYLTSGTGVPLSPDAVRKRHWRYCRAHGLPYVPPKDLRHTWATLAVEAGVDGMAVAAMLGHTDMSTTYRYYLRRPHRALVEAQRKFHDLIVT